MIDENASWFQIVKAHLLTLVGITILSLAAYELVAWNLIVLPSNTLPINVLGIALSVFIGFRNNTAYDRYWEARKLWGNLTNSSRTYGRQVVTFVNPPHYASAEAVLAIHAWKDEMINGMIAYIQALRCSLHDEEPWDDLAGLLPESVISRLQRQRNVPSSILNWLGRRAVEATQNGWLDELRLQRIDSTFNDFANYQGGCERIKKTTIPAYFSLFTYYVVRVYCFVVPFALVESMGIFTAFAGVGFGTVFLLLDGIGRLIEHPFRQGPITLPLTSIALSIEIGLRQTLDPLHSCDEVRPDRTSFRPVTLTEVPTTFASREPKT